MWINYLVCFHPLVDKEVVGCPEISLFKLNYILHLTAQFEN